MPNQVQVAASASRSFAPFVLRLAVAGILGYGGLRNQNFLEGLLKWIAEQHLQSF